MFFFRNPEIKRDLLIYGVLWILGSLLGFWVDSMLGLGIFLCGAASGAYHFSVTYRRYQRLRNLSQEIDRVLHGETKYSFGQYTEGELAILENELEKMLERLQEQTEALQKDKIFLSDLIADISHQIRTPLTSLRLFGALMQKEDLPIERRRELTQDMMRLLDRMDWLIESLLKVSKLDSDTAVFQKDKVMVEDLLFKASELVAIPMELRQQHLTVEMNGQESFIGDLSWSVEAIGNILKNCMEHMENGGEIRIQVQENPVYTEIRIQDQGPGLDPEDLAHLFERFYRGKQASSQSIGIGLALCRMIIKKQNGTIKAENAPEGGALFTVRFYKGTI